MELVHSKADGMTGQLPLAVQEISAAMGPASSMLRYRDRGDHSGGLTVFQKVQTQVKHGMSDQDTRIANMPIRHRIASAVELDESFAVAGRKSGSLGEDTLSGNPPITSYHIPASSAN